MRSIALIPRALLTVDELERAREWLAALFSLDDHAQRDEIVALGFFRCGVIAATATSRGAIFSPFTSISVRIDQAEIADRFHDVRVAGIAQRLVFHHRNLPFVTRAIVESPPAV